MKRLLLGALKSKTILFAGVLSVGTWLTNHTGVVDAVVSSIAGEQWTDFAGYFIAAIVAGLRVVTNKPLEDK